MRRVYLLIWKWLSLALLSAGAQTINDSRLIVETVVSGLTQPLMLVWLNPATNLQGHSPSSYRAVLNWNASRDDDKVVYYEIWRRAPFETKFRKVGTTFAAETTYTDAGLHPDTEYQYYVRAVDTSGNASPASTVVTVRTHP